MNDFDPRNPFDWLAVALPVGFILLLLSLVIGAIAAVWPWIEWR